MRSPINLTTPIRKEEKLQSASLSSAVKQLANLYKLTHPDDPEIQKININKPNPIPYQAAEALITGKPPTNPQAATLFNQWQQQMFQNQDYIALAMETMPQEARDPYIEKWLRESLAQENEQLAAIMEQPTSPQPRSPSIPTPPTQPTTNPTPTLDPNATRTPLTPELTTPLQPSSISPVATESMERLRKLEQGIPFTNIPQADPTITSIIYTQNETSAISIETEAKVPMNPRIAKLKDGQGITKANLADVMAIDGYMLTTIPQRLTDAHLAAMPNMTIDDYQRLSIQDISHIQTKISNTINNRNITNPDDWLKLAQTQRGKRPMLIAIFNDPQDTRQITRQMQLTHYITTTTQNAIQLSETKFKNKPPIVWQVFEMKIDNKSTYQIMPTYLYDNNGKPSYRPLFIIQSRTRIYPYAIYVDKTDQIKRLAQLTLNKNGNRYLIPEEIGLNTNDTRKAVKRFVDWLNENKAILTPFYNAL